ncbi:MAG: phage minor head protein [Betaproteobacteria bacterium]|nr:phage minor head protein [Betaproteobacteria bacterium]
MGIEAQFKRPFDEQVAFFRGKLGNLIPTEKWTDVWKSAHDTGFMVAGAAKADLLTDFAAAVDRAIAEGKGLQAFRQDFDAIVEKHGWSYLGEYNWRTRTIYRTNMATSYAAGRLAQLRSGGFEYWMYRHSDSVASPRPLHVSWNSLTLPADDAWWTTHYPPNGWGCKCYVVGVSRAAGERIGGRFDPAPDDGKDPDGRPKGIDKGWDYMPGATSPLVRGIGSKAEVATSPLVREISRKAEVMPATIAGAMLAGIASTDEFAKWLGQPKGSWPLVRLPDADAAAIGAQKKVADLSAQTAIKQRAAHPELTPDEYREAQAVIDKHTNKAQDSPNSIIYIREVAGPNSGGHVLVVKATQTGKGTFVTSFRRLSRREAEREIEIKRLLLKAGKK